MTPLSDMEALPPVCERCDDGTPGEVGACPYASEVGGCHDDCPANCCNYHRTQCALDI